jgi:hypothetical protein
MRLVTPRAPLLRLAGLVAAVMLLAVADGRDALGQSGARDHRVSRLQVVGDVMQEKMCSRRAVFTILGI